MSSIERKASGFYEWDADRKLQQPHAVGVESARVEECIAHYDQIGAKGLFGNPTFGFQETTLDFLRLAKSKPTWLWFWDVALKNIDALYELEELDHFGIHPKRPGIDFARFRRIRSAVIEWNKHDRGLGEANMEKLYLWRFQPKSKSFEDAEIPDNVRELQLLFASPKSLDGLPVMKRLKRLEIHRCRNLADLSALPRIAPNLQVLLATTSKQLVIDDGVLDHPTLQSAWIDGRERLPGKV